MTKTTRSTETAPSRFMDTAELMQTLGYNSRGTFTRFIQRSGIPMIRLSVNKIIYERTAIEAWLQSRTVGRKLPAHNQTIGNN